MTKRELTDFPPRMIFKKKKIMPFFKTTVVSLGTQERSFSLSLLFV